MKSNKKCSELSSSPKMKVLQSVYAQVREVNAKTENWNNYLEMYQSNNRNISNFLIKALGN
jgi:hypothetical protein